MAFPDIPTAVPDDIVAAAERWHVPPSLLWAIVWRESLNTRLHVTPNDGGSGWPSCGRMQANVGTVRLLGQRWQSTTAKDLLNPDDDRDLEAGCLILRWRMYQALEARGIRVRWVDGWPDYRQAVERIDELPAGERQEVLAHVAASYTAGDAGVTDWPDLAGLTPERRVEKRRYVADVTRFVLAVEDAHE